MLENRSFSTILNSLERENGRQTVADCGFDGFTPVDAAYIQAHGERALKLPQANPFESHEHVFRQMYGERDQIWAAQPSMDGFADEHGRPFSSDDPEYGLEAARMMNAVVPPELTARDDLYHTYTAVALPWTHTLARQYAYSDRWFASMPTQTWANRLSAMCGSSLGVVDNEKLADMALCYFEIRTRFCNTIANAGKTDYDFHLYCQPLGFMAIALNPINYYRHRKGTIMDFVGRLKDGTLKTLPKVTWLEPEFATTNSSHTDQHPFHQLGKQFSKPPVTAADDLIGEVYEALFNNPRVKNTLLIITYDEHGGLPDAAPPPFAPKDRVPWLEAETVVPRDITGVANGVCGTVKEFQRVGVRVPAIFVSDRIVLGDKGVVVPAGTGDADLADPTRHQSFHTHSTILRTVIDLIGGDGNLHRGSTLMNDRVRHARSLFDEPMWGPSGGEADRTARVVNEVRRLKSERAAALVRSSLAAAEGEGPPVGDRDNELVDEFAHSLAVMQILDLWTYQNVTAEDHSEDDALLKYCAEVALFHDMLHGDKAADALEGGQSRAQLDQDMRFHGFCRDVLLDKLLPRVLEHVPATVHGVRYVSNLVSTLGKASLEEAQLVLTARQRQASADDWEKAARGDVNAHLRLSEPMAATRFAGAAMLPAAASAAASAVKPGVLLSDDAAKQRRLVHLYMAARFGRDAHIRDRFLAKAANRSSAAASAAPVHLTTSAFRGFSAAAAAAPEPASESVDRAAEQLNWFGLEPKRPGFWRRDAQASSLPTSLASVASAVASS
jgi:hypothetical protein